MRVRAWVRRRRRFCEIDEGNMCGADGDVDVFW